MPVVAETNSTGDTTYLLASSMKGGSQWLKRNVVSDKHSGGAVPDFNRIPCYPKRSTIRPGTCELDKP